MYGRDTFMRFASSVCDTPSSFIRRRMRRRNAEPILSIALRLRHPKLLHPEKDAAEERRTDSVNRGQWNM